MGFVSNNISCWKTDKRDSKTNKKRKEPWLQLPQGVTNSLLHLASFPDKITHPTPVRSWVYKSLGTAAEGKGEEVTPTGSWVVGLGKQPQGRSQPPQLCCLFLVIVTTWPNDGLCFEGSHTTCSRWGSRATPSQRLAEWPPWPHLCCGPYKRGPPQLAHHSLLPRDTLQSDILLLLLLL